MICQTPNRQPTHLRKMLPLRRWTEPASHEHGRLRRGPGEVLPGILRQVGQHWRDGGQHALQPALGFVSAAFLLRVDCYTLLFTPLTS